MITKLFVFVFATLDAHSFMSIDKVKALASENAGELPLGVVENFLSLSSAVTSEREGRFCLEMGRELYVQLIDAPEGDSRSPEDKIRLAKTLVSRMVSCRAVLITFQDLTAQDYDALAHWEVDAAADSKNLADKEALRQKFIAHFRKAAQMAPDNIDILEGAYARLTDEGVNSLTEAEKAKWKDHILDLKLQQRSGSEVEVLRTLQNSSREKEYRKRLINYWSGKKECGIGTVFALFNAQTIGEAVEFAEKDGDITLGQRLRELTKTCSWGSLRDTVQYHWKKSPPPF